MSDIPVAIGAEGTLPWTKSCFVCGEENPRGLRLRSRIEGNKVVLKYRTMQEDLGYKSIVHGGIAMALLDEVMTWAAILAARRLCVAAEVTTRLKQPLAVGTLLRVEGYITKQSPKLLLTEGKVLGLDGLLYHSAIGKYVPMKSGQITLCDDDFVKSDESLDVDEIID